MAFDQRIGRAILELVTDVAGFKADLQQVKAQSASAMADIGKSVQIAATAFAALDLAGAARRAVDAGSDIADAAERFGVGAEAVQRLTFAAEQGGSSMEAVGTAIRTMATHLTDGDKGAVAALGALNLNLDDLRKMTPDQAFTTIADAIGEVPDPMRQSALAVDLFGRSATELLPAIKAGIGEVGAAAPLMRDETVAALDATGDKWEKMQKRLDNLKAEALEPLLSAFTSMPESLQTAAGGIVSFAPSLESLALGLLAIGGPSGAMAAIKTAVFAVVPLFTTTLPAAFSALLPFLGPIGLIAVAVAAVFVVWKKWDAISGIVMAVYNAVKTWLVDKFNAIVESIRSKVDAVTGFFGRMYDRVVGNSYVPDMVNRIAAEFGRLDGVMVVPAGVATGAIASLFGEMSTSVSGLVSEMLTSISGMLTSWLDSFLPGWAAQLLGGLAQAGINAGIGALTGAGAAAGAAAAGGAGAAGVGGTAAAVGGGVGVGTTIAVTGGIAGAALLGWAIWKKGLFRGGEEGIAVNPARDKFLGQFGGWDATAAQIDAASDGNIAGALMRQLGAADTMDAFRTAEDAIIALIGGQKFAKGGIAMRPLMGLVGEAGPEAVIPLNRLGALIGSQRPIEITVISRLNGVEVARDVVRHMPRALATAGLV